MRIKWSHIVTPIPVLGALAALLLVASPAAAQQEWAPTKPMKVVAPFAPGGTADLLARMLADHYREKLGQPAVVENRTGAGGMIGIEAVIRSAPDGATVETRPASWFEFAYRDSRLKRDPRVLLTALIRLERGDGEAIQREIDEKLEIRRVKHTQWRVEKNAGS